MKYFIASLLSVLLFLTGLNTLAQDSKVDLSNIITVKSDEHLNVPGTRLYLVAPTGYTFAENFVGLKKGKSVVLNVFDHRNVSYFSNIINFDENKFPAGAQVLESKSLHVNQYRAELLLVQNDDKVRSLGIIFGDSTFTAMLMGIYYIGDDKAEDEIKKIFTSLYYDKTLKIDPYEKAIFTLDESKTQFKLIKDNGGTYVFTPNGKARKQNGEDPFVTVRSVPLDSNMNAKGLVEFYLKDLQKYGLEETKIKRAEKLKINGLDSFEQEISGTIKGNKYLIYELAISNGKKAIMLEGSMRVGDEKYLEEVKKLGKTGKFK